MPRSSRRGVARTLFARLGGAVRSRNKDRREGSEMAFRKLAGLAIVGVRTLAAVAAFAVVAALAGPALAAVDYARAPFQTKTHSVTFGQAPVFVPDGRVLF